MERELQALSEWPKLGPWLVISWIWQSRAVRVLANPRKDSRSNSDLFGRSSSPSQPSSLMPEVSSPRFLSDSDGWQKPTKVASQHSPVKKVDSKSSGKKLAKSRKQFLVLTESETSVDVEVGCEGSPSSLDQDMVDAVVLHLKWARSKPRLA